MDILQKYLSELKIYPKNVEEVDYDRFKLYTSDNLKEKFIEAIHNSNLANELKRIDVLVQKGIVVPTFTTKSTMRFIMRKLTANYFYYDPYTDIMGIYRGSKNKIYIIVGNLSSIFGKSDDNALAHTLIHELIHMYAHNDGKSYLKLFMNDLIMYYKYVLDTLLNENYSKNICRKFIIGLFVKFEQPAVVKYIDLKKYYIDSLKEETKNYDKLTDSAHNIAISYALLARGYRTHISSNPELLRINNIFGKAYSSVFNIDMGSLYFSQEMLATSEVIAKLASYPYLENKVPKVISDIIQHHKK